MIKRAIKLVSIISAIIIGVVFVPYWVYPVYLWLLPENDYDHNILGKSYVVEWANGYGTIVIFLAICLVLFFIGLLIYHAYRYIRYGNTKQ